MEAQRAIPRGIASASAEEQIAIMAFVFGIRHAQSSFVAPCIHNFLARTVLFTVWGKSGSFGDSNTVPRGNDPNPPRNRRH
jgi:hypothetical protein